MKIKKFSEKPSDIKNRTGAKPIVCYPNSNIEEKYLTAYLENKGYKPELINRAISQLKITGPTS